MSRCNECKFAIYIIQLSIYVTTCSTGTIWNLGYFLSVWNGVYVGRVLCQPFLSFVNTGNSTKIIFKGQVRFCFHVVSCFLITALV